MASEANKKLFTRRDGRGLCFYLPPSVRDKDGTRTKVKDLIEKHGGRFRTPSLRVSQDDTVVQLVHVGDAGNEKALLAAEERGEKLYFCTYVLDSVAKGELLNLDEYEVHLPPASVPEKRSHHRWTFEDDNAVLAYASKSILARRGDTFWEEAERQKVTQHTWQAMKERYNKLLAPAQKAKATNPAPPVGNVVKDSVSKPAPSNSPFPNPPAIQPKGQASGSEVRKATDRSAAQPIRSEPTSKQTERARVEQKSEQTPHAARAAAGSEAGSSRVEGKRPGDSQPEPGVARAAKTAESRTDGRPALSSLTEEPRSPQKLTNTAPVAVESSKPPSGTATRSEPVHSGRPLTAVRPGQSSQPATMAKVAPLSEPLQGRKQPNQNVKPQESRPLSKNVSSPAPSQSAPRSKTGDERERPKSPLESQPPFRASPSPPAAVPGPKELPPSYLLKPLHGAAVLRASPKTGPPSKPGSVTQPIDILGAAAAVRGQVKKAEGGASQPSASAEERRGGQVLADEQEGGGGQTPLRLYMDPFTQEPGAGCTEAATDDWQESQEEPEPSGKPAGVVTNGNERSGTPVTVLERQKSREAAGTDGKKRARDDAALPAKRQRAGRQHLVPKEKTAGSFSAVLLESDGEEVHGRGEAGGGTAGARLPAGVSERKIDGRDDGKEAGRSNGAEREVHRAEPNGRDVNGAGAREELVEGVAEVGRVASKGDGSHGQAEAAGKNVQETKRRRLQKVNGEPVARHEQPAGEQPEPSDQAATERTSADLAPERVSEIRSWVATFMKEYGCSQDDVIKALINASGKFEAARPFLDARNRGDVREPGWGLREDHVLLTMPVEERDKHPAFVSLRQTFGNDAVEQRLRFLGRLEPE